MFCNPIEGVLIKEEICDEIFRLTNNLDAESKDMLFQELRETLSKQKKKIKEAKHIFVGSNKGGVGKTTLAIQLAWVLNTLGYKVLLADMDAQANITCAFLEDENAIESEVSLYDVLAGGADVGRSISEVVPGFEIMGGNERLSEIDFYIRSKDNEFEDIGADSVFGEGKAVRDDTLNQVYLEAEAILKNIGKNYDFVVYDTNPETNKFNRLSMQVSDIFIIPFQPKESSMKAYGQTRAEILDSLDYLGRDVNLLRHRIKIVINEAQKIPEKKRSLVLDKISEMYGDALIKPIIPYDYYMGEASDAGWPIFCHEEASLESIEVMFTLVNKFVDILSRDSNKAKRPGKRNLFMSLGGK